MSSAYIRQLTDHLLCVATTPGGVIGYAWAQDYGPHLRTGERTPRIHDLIVEPDARRRGTGIALFTFVRAWATERDVTYLQWQSSQAGLAFYRALGLSGDPCPDPDHPFFELMLRPPA